MAISKKVKEQIKQLTETFNDLLLCVIYLSKKGPFPLLLGHIIPATRSDGSPRAIEA